jgi:hypothetical protein
MALIDDIKAKFPNLAPETRDDGAIAAALSIGRVRVVPTLGGIGTVLEALGPTDGAQLLDDLTAMSATVPAVRWAMVLVNRGDLDFGSTATRTMIDQVVTDAAKAAKLKAVAEVPDVVTAQQVAQALEGVFQ